VDLRHFSLFVVDIFVVAALDFGQIREQNYVTTGTFAVPEQQQPIFPIADLRLSRAAAIKLSGKWQKSCWKLSVGFNLFPIQGNPG